MFFVISLFYLLKNVLHTNYLNATSKYSAFLWKKKGICSEILNNFQYKKILFVCENAKATTSLCSQSGYTQLWCNHTAVCIPPPCSSDCDNQVPKKDKCTVSTPVNMKGLWSSSLVSPVKGEEGWGWGAERSGRKIIRTSYQSIRTDGSSAWICCLFKQFFFPLSPHASSAWGIVAK